MEIYLPTPVTEGRVPGGALLLGALVVAGVIYGVWYYLSATDRSIADLVPALPERLVALLDSRAPTDPATGLPRTGEAPAAHPTATPAPAAAPAASGGAASGGAASGGAAPAAPAPAPAAPAAGAKPAPAVSASMSPVPAVPKPAAATPPAPGGEEEEGDGAAQEPTPLSGNGAAAPVPTVAAAAEPPADLGPPKRTYGSQNASAHIQIRATQDSWLQIRDGNTEIFTRVLKPGDVYRVPDNKPGLKMRTGNAGGLIPIIGGVPGAPLGSAGQVMRDVPVESLGAKPH
ncbi:DUF4115 domain-containing protein [Azospirillum fermentarium]|uniref:DUF4115 domain-containing protein n=1 Tax=Azospirillum fermentarium TaxID=1233114 RepID=UPI00387385EA